jgi:hypothetical protein
MHSLCLPPFPCGQCLPWLISMNYSAESGPTTEYTEYTGREKDNNKCILYVLLFFRVVLVNADSETTSDVPEGFPRRRVQGNALAQPLDSRSVLGLAGHLDLAVVLWKC